MFPFQMEPSIVGKESEIQKDNLLGKYLGIKTKMHI